jgi:hypothetical protein
MTIYIVNEVIQSDKSRLVRLLKRFFFSLFINSFVHVRLLCSEHFTDALVVPHSCEHGSLANTFAFLIVEPSKYIIKFDVTFNKRVNQVSFLLFVRVLLVLIMLLKLFEILGKLPLKESVLSYLLNSAI